MISVIIPVYNSEKIIVKTFESLLEQTVLAYEKMEIIVVDDGSTDATKRVVEKFIENNPQCHLERSEARVERSHDSKFSRGQISPQGRNDVWVKYIKQKNAGASAARNAGFRQSKGEYLLFCDSDVILQPKMLEKMRRGLEGFPDTGFAYSAHKYGWKTFNLWYFNREKLKQMPYINTNTLIKREAFPKDGWDENLRRFQDWDLFLRIVEQGYTGVWLPDILFKITPRRGGISSWLPKIMYRLPVKIKRAREYSTAMAIIKAKHKLE